MTVSLFDNQQAALASISDDRFTRGGMSHPNPPQGHKV
jgi:hypothetical protein